MKLKIFVQILIALGPVIFISCDKGYQVRFINFNTERMDSVVIGDNTVVFTNVDLQSETDYLKIKKGKYKVSCITTSKKKFYSDITIPGSGSGKRSVQIDAINNFSILED